MKRTSLKWKNLPLFFRIFLFVALAFAVVGFGTLGSVQTAGSAYELQRKTSADNQEPDIIFHLKENEVDLPSGTEVRLKQIYLNIGTVYSNTPYARLRIIRASSATSSYFTSTSLSSTYYRDAKIENPYYVVPEIPVPDTEGMSEADAKKLLDEYNKKVEEQEKDLEGRIDGDFYNWITPFDVSEWGELDFSSYTSYIKLTTTQNILINEIVFVGEGYKDKEFTGKQFVIPAEISDKSHIPYNAAAGETMATAQKKAAALLDSQKIPARSQSSFVRFTSEEQEMMYTVAEMKIGSTYVAGDIYRGNTTYNAFGLDMIALGTLIFGASPFGLRFFPMLASLGILIVGYLFVKRLFKSDKAAFIFAVLYALSGLSLSLAHVGTAVMIGLFFLLASLDGCHRFYVSGMKKANPKSALPLLLSGICGALAVCVNGAFIIPVAGVAALFVLGMVRQQKAKRYYLDKAIEQAEAEEAGGETAPAVAEEGKEPPLTGKQKVAKVLNEYNYKNIAAPVVFGVSLIIGAILFSLLFMVPASALYLKVYYSPSSSASIFALTSKAFAAGFTGSSAAVWSPYCILFRGIGERYAVTSVSANLIALAAGIFGIALSVYRVIALCLKRDFGKEFRAELRSIAVPFAGLVLCLITASFAGGALAFIAGAYVFSFVLAAGAFKTLSGMGKKCAAVCEATLVIGFAVLATMFLINLVFTFSVPLPASFMTKIFG